MIYLQISGRCGNQLFQYAFMRELMLNKNIEDKYIVNTYYVEKNKKLDLYWENTLQEFCLPQPIKTIEVDNVVEKYGDNKQKKVYIIYSRIRKIVAKSRYLVEKYDFWGKWYLAKYGIYLGSRRVYNINSTINHNNIFIMGNFDNRRWFDDIKNVLFNEIRPKEIEHLSEFGSIINNSNSVCVSVRRGDYLGSKLRNVCTEAYYYEAIKKMSELLQTPVFYFFSDDIEWCKAKFGGMQNVYFESGMDSIGMKLFYMSSCKHFIISNSTFSWWAQYLSTNDNKIVVSPSIWMNSKGYDTYIEKNWVKIVV